MATVLSREEIRQRLGRVPRFKLSHLNTPLEEAHALRRALEAGGQAVPRILVKRDDVTGLAFGGNKGRHFEFETAHILEGGSDTVINVNHYHSNQARFIAAACARAGLRYILVSTGLVDRPLQGNLLLCKLMGAEIHRVPGEGALEYARNIAAGLKARGSKPYLVNDDTFPEMMGTIGFLECGLEIEGQLEALGVAPTARPEGDRDASLRPPGPAVRVWGLSGRSIPGLRLYARNRGLNWRATAVTYSPQSAGQVRDTLVRGAGMVADLLDLPERLGPGDIDVLTTYAGPGYGVPYDGVLEAMHLAAKTESLILDPNYTGKSMAALIGEVRAGRADPSETIVFIHSGGLPQVFAFAEEIWEWAPGSKLTAIS